MGNTALGYTYWPGSSLLQSGIWDMLFVLTSPPSFSHHTRQSLTEADAAGEAGRLDQRLSFRAWHLITSA